MAPGTADSPHIWTQDMEEEEGGDVGRYVWFANLSVSES